MHGAALLGAALLASCGGNLCVRTQPADMLGIPAGGEFALQAGGLDILAECDRPAPGSVRWSSSNPDVATVDEHGRVRARQAGTVEITARTGRRGRVITPLRIHPRVARVQVHASSSLASVGDTVRVEAAAFDGAGRRLDIPILITADGAGMPVDRGGSILAPPWTDLNQHYSGRLDFRANSPGTTMVRALVIGHADSLEINVR